ncbi:transcription activator [Clostridioides difficile]|nr:transcription activator [Clostridioides difficile]
MKIEEFEDIKIAYIRRVGKYGLENKHLMETFKAYLKAKGLFKEEATILGIALDNPMYISEERQRYDVGIIISDKKSNYDLPIRNIASGRYAIFEVEHTEECVSDFWKNIQTLTADLSIDISKPIIERYTLSKISLHLCEFCIPLK